MNENEANEFKDNLIQDLLSMGISEDIAKEALLVTGQCSIEAAVNYIFDVYNDTCEGDVTIRSENSGDDGDWEDQGVAYYKMTFVINNSLKMNVAKVASLVGDACIGLYKLILQNGPEDDLKQWQRIGQKKIVLKGNDADLLLELYSKANQMGIPAYLVQSEGNIQVLSLFGLEECVDEISGKLPLL